MTTISSPDYLPLDYYFWNAVKQEVYSGQSVPLKDLKELKKKSNRFGAAAAKSNC